MTTIHAPSNEARRKAAIPSAGNATNATLDRGHPADRARHDSIMLIAVSTSSSSSIQLACANSQRTSVDWTVRNRETSSTSSILCAKNHAIARYMKETRHRDTSMRFRLICLVMAIEATATELAAHSWMQSMRNCPHAISKSVTASVRWERTLHASEIEPVTIHTHPTNAIHRVSDLTWRGSLAASGLWSRARAPSSSHSGHGAAASNPTRSYPHREHGSVGVCVEGGMC